MLEVTTESGRKYLIDVEDGFWRRLPKTPGGYPGGWERIWSLQKGTHFAHPFDSPKGTWEDGMPEVGKYMHVGSRDVWWTSTKVASIKEVDNERGDGESLSL